MGGGVLKGGYRQERDTDRLLWHGRGSVDEALQIIGLDLPSLAAAAQPLLQSVLHIHAQGQRGPKGSQEIRFRALGHVKNKQKLSPARAR